MPASRDVSRRKLRALHLRVVPPPPPPSRLARLAAFLRSLVGRGAAKAGRG